MSGEFKPEFLVELCIQETILDLESKAQPTIEANRLQALKILRDWDWEKILRHYFSAPANNPKVWEAQADLAAAAALTGHTGPGAMWRVEDREWIIKKFKGA